MDYHKKYLKYKRKFLNLVKKGGGDNENLDFFLNFNNKYIDIINKYEKFNNFSLINNPIKRLGKKSANGVINFINFNNTNDTNKFSNIKYDSFSIPIPQYSLSRLLLPLKLS